jgi:pimeloyl-ACP methyl ester carboxylesterase
VLGDVLYHRPAATEPSPFVIGLRHAFEATIAQFVDTCLTDRDGEAVRHWGRQILMRSSQAAAIRLYEAYDGIDLRPQVSQITLPTLIVHGAKDRIVPVEAAGWLASQMPNSRLCIIEDAGHVPTLTHPREVADAINDAFPD